MPRSLRPDRSDPEFRQRVCLRLRKSPVKSNDRMLPRTKANVTDLENRIRCWNSPHRRQAAAFMERIGPERLYEILHGMRRWYSGQTMTGALIRHRDTLAEVMRLDPAATKGVFRGFKVPKDDPLAQKQPGETVTLPVARNHGISSWSTSRELTNRFSGGGKGKVGLIVQLVDPAGTQPLIAPPAKTRPWFNALYSEIIGRSFRPGEGEYLIRAPAVRVKIVQVKR